MAKKKSPNKKAPVKKPPLMVLSEPSKDPNKKHTFLRKGTSGTELFGGFFNEEYLFKLRGNRAAQEYDEMRRGDAQIKMLLGVTKAPVLSAEWSITAVDDSEEELFIKDFVEHVLFKDIGNPDTGKRKTWLEFIEEAMTMPDFGYALFEITNKIVTGHPKFGNYVGLRDIGFRSPKTIEEWILHKDGAIKFVRQQAQGDLSTDKKMDGRFLMHMAINKEGDNYEGIAMLRFIYGNWFRKCLYRKLEGIGHEKTTLGTPMGTVPEGMENTEDADEFEAVLESLTSHERGYILKSFGWDIDNFKIEFDAEKIRATISSENIEMTKAFLANFMELGLDGSGSLALSQDLSAIFLGTLSLYGTKIIEAVNMKIIEQIVDAKFGKREFYPSLAVTGISDKAGKPFADILKLLVDAGLIDPTDVRIKSFTHDKFKLPKFQESVEAEEASPGTEEEDDDDEVEAKVKLSELRLAEKPAKKTVKKQMKRDSEDLTDIMREGLALLSEKYIKDIENIMKNNPRSEWSSRARTLKFKGVKKYEDSIKGNLSDVVIRATSQAWSEVPVKRFKLGEFENEMKAAGLSNETIEKIKGSTLNLSKTQREDISKRIIFLMDTQIAKSQTDVQILADLSEAAVAYVNGVNIATAANNQVSDNTNASRLQVFQSPEVFEQIEVLEFFNTSPVSAVCINLNRTVFLKDDPRAVEYYPPLHHWCKSILIAYFKGEKNIPKASPLGLRPTGTEAELVKIANSKTF